MILPDSRICEPYSSPHMVWVPVPASEEVIGLGDGARLVRENGTLATTGTVIPATNPPPTVNTSTAATGVTAVEITDDLTVCKLKVMNKRISEAPKHRRKMIWGKEDDPCSKTVKWTEYAEPLPRPPL